MDFLESVLPMEGNTAPLKRAGIGFGIGYGGMMVLKPGVAFDDNGNERPSKWKDSSAADGTYLTPWVMGVIGAVALGVLV